MIPPLLAHWGYTEEGMGEMVKVLRTATNSKATGPPTEGEVSLIELLLAADRLHQAGYETRLRWVGGEPEVK